MKKFFFSLSALAALFLAGSCQRENLEPVQQGGTVTYTVQVPGALATKAAGDYELIYEVYRAAEVATSADPIYEGTQTFSGNSVNLPLEFVKDQNFVVLFWAQKVGLTAYNTGNLRNVTLNSGLTANQENYEVFAGKDEVASCVSSSNGNVVLVRPIAQLNIATDAEGLKLGDKEVGLISSFVTVKGLSTTYNVYNKTVSETLSDVEFSVAAVPGGKLGNTDYKYVAMNYIGFIDANGTTVNVDFTVKTSEGDIAHSVSSVPVKPNNKTNIIGNLITATDNYQVTLGAWGNEETNVEVVAVSTAQELQEAIKEIQDGAEGNIILEGDINLGALFGASTLSVTKAGNAQLPIVIPEGKTMTLDLNGFTITTPWEDETAGKHYYAFDNKGTLNIVDSKVNGKIKARGIFNYGKMTLESGTIDACDGNGGYGVRNYEGAEFVMNGGSIVTSLEDDNKVNNGGYDATTLRVDAGATATINGGTINNICDFTFALDNYGTTTVNGGEFTSIHTTAANNGTLTIDGGSFTINGLEGITAHALWAAAGTTTINGGTFDGKDNYNGFNVDASAGAEVNITGGKFLPVHSGSLYGEGTINVKGGEFFDDPSARVADDYVAVKDEIANVYNVVEAYAKVGEVKYTSLNDAFASVPENGEATIVVLRDTEMDAVIVAKGKKITLDLNGKTVSNITSGTGNQDVILVNGTLNVTNGTITTEHKGENLGWSAMSTIFDITAGGVVNLNGVTAKNLGGTDMGFVAHLNNWGEVTLTAENCTLESNYVAVRVFNSGYDKNNVTIKNSTLKGGNYAVWVHNYTVADFGTAEKAIAQQKLLNFNLTEGNTFVGKNDTPIRLGMTGSMYLAADQIGNLPTYASVDSEETLIAALKNASSVNSIIYFANDITISNKWDNRYTGAKTSKPIEINGNGKTLKFTGEISDGYNFHAAFRFENSAVVKNLTVDMSKATAPGMWLRAISSHGELTVVNCAFVGSGKYSKANAVVFGDKSGSAQHDYTATITDCTFTNWSRGISDNENANEVRSVTVKNNTCTSAHVYLSAYETVTFAGNTMDNSCVNIKSYSAPDSVIITVEDNDLDENQDNNF